MSLVPSTLEDMGKDLEQQAQMAQLELVGQAELTRQEKVARQRALDKLGLPSFAKTCKVTIWIVRKP